jgi:DHA1 family purine ribonucleoside efflux pump-like MFS transporter
VGAEGAALFTRRSAASTAKYVQSAETPRRDGRDVRHFMAFAGQFAFFTYIRPVYMTLAGFDVDGLTLVLLSFGIASFIGTSLSSVILKRSVKAALTAAPLVLATSATVLVLWGESQVVASAVAVIWGFAFALIPVGWSTWITRSLSDQAEKAGSIQVAVIQLANTCGAAVVAWRWIILACYRRW